MWNRHSICFFPLPNNSDSEAKGDEWAIEELNGLDNSVNNSWRNNYSISEQSESKCDLYFDIHFHFPPVNDSGPIMTEHEEEHDEE